VRSVWVTISLVLCGAIAVGCLWLWKSATGETAPWTGSQPAQPGEPTPDPSASGVGVPDPVDDTDASARMRSPPTLPGATPDTRIAAIDVLVVSGAIDAAFEPLADIDVSLIVAADQNRAITFVERTDPRGVAHFGVVGGDGHSVLATCGLGAEASATLAADQTVQTTLRIVPRLLVQGSVVDAGGRGIAGASIVLLPWVDRASDVPRLCHVGSSRADGSFRVGLAAGGRLAALHPDYSPSAMYFVRPDPDRTKPSPTVTLLLALLTQQVKLEGTVIDAAGLPVAGAEIECRGMGTVPPRAELAAPPQRASTDGEGAFLVQHLPPGRIEYTVRAAGHGSARHSIDTTPGQTAKIRVQLPPACEVHGHVRNTDGTPVANARVWSDVPGTLFSRTTATAADGSFRLRDLPPGDNLLTARAAQQAGAAPRQVAERLVLGPAAPTQWTAILDAAAAGRCVEGVVVDPTGAPLPEWRVVVRSHGNAEVTTTAADGRFVLAAPKAATVDVRVYAPGQQLMSFAAAIVRGVVPGERSLRITVDKDQPIAGMRGQVSTTAQQPVAATISCWHHERAEWVSFQAATDGTFGIDTVPPGTVDLQFDYTGHVTAHRAALTLVGGARLDLGVIELSAAGILHGTVCGPDGQAPALCQITIEYKEQQFVAEYVAGTYRFSAVPPGQHGLQVQGQGVAAATFTVEVQAGVEIQRNILLQAGVPRRFLANVPLQPGTLKAPEFAGLAIRAAAGKPTSWQAQAPISWTGSTGKAEWIAYMAPGSYEVVAWTRGDLEARKAVQFMPGDDSQVQLDLRRK
jgi:hypothetical protein